MSPDPTPDDPAHQRAWFPATATARIAIVMIGVALPYLARIPGMILYGAAWMRSYLESGVDGFLLIGGFNAINWGLILLLTSRFRSLLALVVAEAIGFAVPAFGHATLDLAADAQSAIAIPMFPIMSIPFVGIGWLVGLVIDRRRMRAGHSVGGTVETQRKQHH